MDNKLFVGNLSYQTTDEELRSLFSQAGNVTSVAVIKDRETGRSKGFAFVEMGSQAEAEEAIKLFNGTSYGNRTIKVDLARPREDRGFSKFDNGQGGGFRDRNRRSGPGGSGGGGGGRY